ncbi:MAG: DUF1080 domain-containing protein [Opitutaceae bacterium]|jgi:hypothetical protein
MKSPRCILVAFLCLISSAFAAGDAKPFLGSWALDLPGSGAGWLGVAEKDGVLQASLLWGGGSVEPVTSASIDGDTLTVVKKSKWTKKETSGKEQVISSTRTITAKRSGNTLAMTSSFIGTEEPKGKKETFKGTFLPPPPSAPDLSKLRYGAPIVLFNGKDLSGWKLLNPTDVNGWSVEDGVLINRPVQEEGKTHKHYGNLRTVAEFSDFNLRLEARPTAGSNSGVYLRGIYEVQILDSYGKPLDSHNMGALYSRIRPSAAAEKPAGEWQSLDITLAKRHLTVVLNGTTIIDNQPMLGCTGGALWSDVFRPGPIYLQGDHSQIDYRNIVLRPVLE